MTLDSVKMRDKDLLKKVPGENDNDVFRDMMKFKKHQDNELNRELKQVDEKTENSKQEESDQSQLKGRLLEETTKRKLATKNFQPPKRTEKGCFVEYDENQKEIKRRPLGFFDTYNKKGEKYDRSEYGTLIGYDKHGGDLY